MIELTYLVHFHTPVHVGTGYGFAGFLDSVVVRDGQGQVYLPGSTIKGKARAAARRLARGLGLGSLLCPVGMPCGLVSGEPCPVCRLFGSPQFPGQLHFDNVQLPAHYRELLAQLAREDRLTARRAVTESRTGVMLSRRRRAARPEHLFTYELVRTDLPLAGRIVGEVIGREGQDAIALQDDLVLLWGALGLVTHLGRARGRGLGRCSIEVTSVEAAGQPFTAADYAAALCVLKEETQP
jgi:CRISPR/Cas system CSM-associated protein Csm3 (group 7 of RAMP superfamily)